MGSHRFGLGKNRTPQEAREELTLPCLLILLDAAKLDFGLSTIAKPAPLVYIRRSTRTRSVVNSLDGIDYALDSNYVAVNQKQWDTAVAPVLDSFDMRSPLNQRLLESNVGQVLDVLGASLEASFTRAGYGPGSNTFPVAPVPFVPSDLEGLVGWFDAGDSSTILLNGPAGVRRWANKVTNVHASQQVLADQPQVVAADLNGRDVISFDGVTQHLTLPLRVLDDFTLFVVGKYQVTGSAIGTWFAATGFEGSFGGPDCRVHQDGSGAPSGTPVMAVKTVDYIPTSLALAANTYGIVEYRESIGGAGTMAVGVDDSATTIFTGDTTDDHWDPGQELFGQSPPILAAIGRRNAGINGAASYDYLEGSLAEIVLYERVLSDDERAFVHLYLQTAWGLP